MRVIKLGGSLMKMGLLKFWLEQISLHAKGQSVILPGGGLFADFIRESQATWNFDDKTAHLMALSSMDQYAYYCHSLQPDFELARSVEEITLYLKKGITPICMASCLFKSTDKLSPSWDITSDSISAYLANVLESDALILVKKLPDTSTYDDIECLADKGIVDKAFPSFVKKISCPLYFLEATQPEALKTIFA